jgi:hypothetical protein
VDEIFFDISNYYLETDYEWNNAKNMDIWQE